MPRKPHSLSQLSPGGMKVSYFRKPRSKALLSLALWLGTGPWKPWFDFLKWRQVLLCGDIKELGHAHPNQDAQKCLFIPNRIEGLKVKFLFKLVQDSWVKAKYSSVLNRLLLEDNFEETPGWDIVSCKGSWDPGRGQHLSASLEVTIRLHEVYPVMNYRNMKHRQPFSWELGGPCWREGCY